MNTTVFSPQGHACPLARGVCLSLSPCSQAGQGAGAGDLGLKPGWEEPGETSVESQAVLEPELEPWHPGPVLDLE